MGAGDALEVVQRRYFEALWLEKAGSSLRDVSEGSGGALPSGPVCAPVASPSRDSPSP